MILVEVQLEVEAVQTFKCFVEQCRKQLGSPLFPVTMFQISTVGV